MPKPNIDFIELGNAVIESDGIGFLVMYPDGSVKSYISYVKALASVKSWFSKRTPKGKNSFGTLTAYGMTTKSVYWSKAKGE